MRRRLKPRARGLILWVLVLVPLACALTSGAMATGTIHPRVVATGFGVWVGQMVKSPSGRDEGVVARHQAKIANFP